MGCSLSKEARNFIDDVNGGEFHCTVCQQRDSDGDYLIFCFFCPNTFHLGCHLPVLDQNPEGNWQCLLCKPRGEVFNDPEEEGNKSCPEDSIQFRSRKEFITACKFLSEVYMIPESVVTRSNFEKGCKLSNLEGGEPTYSLGSIRTRLTLMKPKPYNYFSEMLYELKNMFGQATNFYIETSDEYKRTKSFEAQFSALCESYLPIIENFLQPPQELLD